MSKHKKQPKPNGRQGSPRQVKAKVIKPWVIDLAQDGVCFTVKYPDGSMTVVSPSSINEMFNEYMPVALSKPYPQVEQSFNPPLVLKNPLQAAFCDTLIRMSPEGHKVWKGIGFVFQMQMNNYLHGCLNLIGAVECGWMLQQVSQAVCAGTASVPEALAWIDSQRFSSASGAYGDGWIEQRWNMLKDALGLAPVG